MALGEKSFLLGRGRGLDHVIVFVRDLEAAKDVYRDKLGFWVSPLGDNGILDSGQAFSEISFQGNYLELRAIHDRNRARRDRPRFVEFLEKHEGALIFVVNVSPIESTVVLLRQRGFDVIDPVSAPFGSYATFENYFVTLDVEMGASPTRVISFSEYAPLIEERFHGTKVEEWQMHPNSARRIRSVWLAVRNLETATEAYKSIGFIEGRKLELPQLQAFGHEIIAGQGTILLLQPTERNGAVESFLLNRGEGIMGITIEVSDLGVARELVESKTDRNWKPYPGAYGSSIAISADLTFGMWVEMFQST